MMPLWLAPPLVVALTAVGLVGCGVALYIVIRWF
jgi:hypothetical protein